MLFIFYKVLFNTDCSALYWRKMSNSKMLNKPIEELIGRKLEAALKPTYCNVINESYMHNVPKGSETHFKVVVVSKEFDKQPLIERHRLINQLLQMELQGGVHALSITAKTPDEWEVSKKAIETSPACRGGFGK